MYVAALNEGSICLRIDKSTLLKELKEFIDDEKALDYRDEFLATLNKNKYTDLITLEKDLYIPIVRQKSSRADILYFKKYFEHENSLIKGVRSLLQIGPLNREHLKDCDIVINEVIKERPIFLEHGKPMKLDAGQEKAIRLALTNNFLLISGGPGTGKTSILVNILRCLVRDGIQPGRIMISAPTGRAAQRITESLQKSLMIIKDPSPEDISLKSVSASTIHRMLKYNPVKNIFVYQSENKLQADVVIVDEVSMVDVCLMDYLLSAIDLLRTRVILLGDRDQLPSVEAGAVLANLIPEKSGAGSMQGHIVILEKDYRSKGAIRNIAKEIRKKNRKKAIDWPEPVTIHEALKTEPGGYSIIEGSDQTEWIETVKIWADYFYCHSDASGKTYVDLINESSLIDFDELDNPDIRGLLDKIFFCLQKSIILTVLRDSIYGCTGVNSFLAEYLRPRLDPFGRGERFNGAAVLITKNDYSKELFNGDTGVMFKDNNGVYRSIFIKNGCYYSYLLDSIPSHELAFARTIHKSQGSEFDNVLMVLPEKGGEALLAREIIYTGLTRAKERAFIYGQKSVLNRAVDRKIERLSGFKVD